MTTPAEDSHRCRSMVNEHVDLDHDGRITTYHVRCALWKGHGDDLFHTDNEHLSWENTEFVWRPGMDQ